MTVRPEFGDAIPVEGVRPAWLPDDVLLQFREGSNWCDGTYRAYELKAHHWPLITEIRLEVPRYDFVYLALERGMVPWFGGDEAPGDWDGGNVIVRDGYTVRPGTGENAFSWKHPHMNVGFPTLGGDIIGYTRKATSTALPLAHPAAPQGEEVVTQIADLVARLHRDADRWMAGDGGRYNEEAGLLSYHAAVLLGRLPRLIGAARRAVEASDWASNEPEWRERIATLDQAAEQFAASVPWDDEPAALAPAAIASGREGAEPMWTSADCPRCDGERVIHVEDRPYPNDIIPSTHQEPCPECTA